ncbi:hypothetical protein J1N35_034737 [Gossypium stocksii]|uniref:Uncharacterized protein n=1 Tax=Gossypium stocksii TaxID=47602 RepID=A0A9D3USM3_9ROSI|nr:hypothetical protein J1N35_034737 [Gossypium stocksii]
MKFNHINALRNQARDWIFDLDELQLDVVKFFQKFYRELLTQYGDLPFNLFPHLDHYDKGFLEKGISNEEIKYALFDMTPLKAPCHIPKIELVEIGLMNREWSCPICFYDILLI